VFPSNFVEVLPENFRPTTRSVSPLPDSNTPSPKNTPSKSKTFRKPFEAYAKAPHYTTAKQPVTYKDGTQVRSRDNSGGSFQQKDPVRMRAHSPAPPPSNDYGSRVPSPAPYQYGSFSSRAPSPAPHHHDPYASRGPSPAPPHHDPYGSRVPSPAPPHHHSYGSRAPSPAPPQQYNYGSRAVSPAPSMHGGYRAASPAPPGHDGFRAVSPAPSVAYPGQRSVSPAPSFDDRHFQAYRPGVEARSDSPPPPPPPPHRHVNVARQESNASYRNPLNIRHGSNASYGGVGHGLERHGSHTSYNPSGNGGLHTPRVPSPCPPSPGGSHMTPSPLREAMDGVIEQLDALGRPHEPDAQVEPLNPWSPECFDMVSSRNKSGKGAQ